MKDRLLSRMCTSPIICRAVVLVIGLTVLLWLLASQACAEEVIEAWRSPFGACRAVSVNTSDGSCWVADGSTLLHLAADGTIISQTTGFQQPWAVSVNPSDGSCWVADKGNGQVVHLAEDGTELWRGVDFGGFAHGNSISVNPTDGSCWVADSFNAQVVHLAQDGTELWRGGAFVEPRGISVDPTDGSFWMSDSQGVDQMDYDLVHVAEDGTELWRGVGLGGQSVCVNPTDGSCWVALRRVGQVVHVASDGTELWRGGFFDRPGALSVNPTDGACWVADSGLQNIVHLAEDGSELWRAGFSPSDTGSDVSVDRADGSCWFGGVSEVVHVAENGTELWRGEGFNWPNSVSVNPTDNSCWVADSRNDQVVHLAEDGTELWCREGLEAPSYVVVNPADGSCWASGVFGIAHLAEDGTELWQGGAQGKLSVNPTDGSCWVAETGTGQVIHLAEDGTELWRGGGFGSFGWYDCISANPTDGSCWVADYDNDAVVHLAEDGTALLRVALSIYFNPFSVAVNPADGSCWVAGGDGAFLLLAEDGAELSSFDGPSYPSVSLNTADGSLWVGEGFAGVSVTHLAPDGTELWRGVGFGTPWGVSVNPSDGSCWVADTRNSQVVHLVIPGWEAPVFPDVPFGFWAFDEVEACADAEIVGGYGDGLYHPANPVTRDQMAVFISRSICTPTGEAGLVDYVPPTTPSFSDVPTDFWCYRYIEYAVEHTIVGGYEDGTYQPGLPLDRGQMAVFIARAIAGDDQSVPDPTGDPSFPDVPADFWSYRHIEYIAGEGVAGGYFDGLYHPENPVDRAQMAVFICRAFHLT